MDPIPLGAAAQRLEKPGDALRRLRSRLGITAREVEELSRKIVAEHNTAPAFNR